MTKTAFLGRAVARAKYLKSQIKVFFRVRGKFSRVEEKRGHPFKQSRINGCSTLINRTKLYGFTSSTNIFSPIFHIYFVEKKVPRYSFLLICNSISSYLSRWESDTWHLPFIKIHSKAPVRLYPPGILLQLFFSFHNKKLALSRNRSSFH